MDVCTKFDSTCIKFMTFMRLIKFRGKSFGFYGIHIAHLGSNKTFKCLERN